MIRIVNLQDVDEPSEFSLYAHGGMGLWMVSSGFFAIVSS